MSADRSEERWDILCGQIAVHESREEVITPHQQSRIVEFMAVERIRCTDALTPAGTDVGANFQQQDILGGLGAE